MIKTIFKSIKSQYLAYAVIALLIIIAVVYFVKHETTKSYEVSAGRVHNIENIVQLCTVDLYNEIPVRDTVNNKEIFAIQKQRGSVSFDMEKLNVNSDGDTVKIMLPAEIVDLYEATDDNSWQVVDTKGLDLFTSNKLTAEEDNIVKRRIKERSKKLLYTNGTIERARAEGVKDLQALMEKVYQKPVVVNDTTPKGYYASKYF